MQNLSRSLGLFETLALAFGAMIGWGWVLMAGPWLEQGGSAGAVLAFLIVGSGILIIAFLYAELASAMPKVGGEHVYSLRAFGRTGSFVCSWSICMVYVAVAAFEAVAFATVLEYFAPDMKQIYLWRVAGYDVYLTWVLAGIAGSVGVTIINVMGVKLSAVFQVTMTAVVLFAGILLISGALFEGRAENMEPLFNSGAAGVLSVVALVVFYFIGFDVIPQAAEEIDMPAKSIAVLLVTAVGCAVLWYASILIAVTFIFDDQSIADAALPAADAAALVWGEAGAKLLILGGLAGIITSWNGFVIGGSRLIYALAESDMMPAYLGKLHPRFRTPYRAIILIGAIACCAPLFGRQVLLWITNAAGFAAIIAYLLVAIAFIVLRHREPDMPRPFKLPMGQLWGWAGVVVAAALAFAYLPWSPGALTWPQEWLMLILWYVAGAVLFVSSSMNAKGIE